MTNYNVELNDETVDEIMVARMFETRSALLQGYIKGTIGMVDFNPEEERRQLGDYIKALEKVIDWYSVPNSVTFDELPVFDEDNGIYMSEEEKLAFVNVAATYGTK